MDQIKPGDIVARKSYGKDIFFKVKALTITDKGTTTAILRGLDVRLVADAPLDDLELQPAEEVLRYRHDDIQRHNLCIRRILQRRAVEKEALFTRSEEATAREKSADRQATPENFFEVPGRVLHLDGDEEYLDKCLHAYEQLKLPAHGVYVPEEQQANKVKDLLQEYTPDILVLTGHDGLLRERSNFSDLDSYRHSKHFLAAVKAARALRPGHDDLVIFAGACQSHYEALLKAGATFASSPLRVLIHAYDPVFVVERVAYTSIEKTLAPAEIIKDTITGNEGVGGVEIKGKLRLGYPSSPY
ncbi:peptidase [Moorella thermoacetica]|uniref:sporulation peptidase YabG n=1 Tax=Neomoorella thermoacetica TaxID=1525 RepID=UPI000039B543|nr:sporulation peptidase YabG [Moorella thermoacetica]AKX92885.1 sporulation-specific protease YabG [Moorella thermoacetica]AKX95438.1 sporulation-specific protease YabG [Moorella thermoacetica]OIQ56893.1 sporulation-specific protease YabG [Moorella thermoacetica]QCZ99247.1 Sporulation-specific protease YabG [Moorella thermoacetica]TYL09104.1 Sporulation-specific protease YabG [Moorella thermoacetica]